MTALDRVITLIKGFEGFRTNAYQDKGGRWTVGYGFTGSDIGPGTTITREAAEARLASLAGNVLHDVQGLVKVPLTDGQLAACCSLTYNIGQAAFSGSTVLKRLNAYDYQGAADAFLLWDKEHVNGVLTEDRDLLARRKDERALFMLCTTQKHPPEEVA